MKLSQVRDFVNQVHDHNARKAFHALLDALIEAGLEIVLEEKELAAKMFEQQRQEDEEELANLKAENAYVAANLPDEDENLDEELDEETNEEEVVNNDATDEGNPE